VEPHRSRPGDRGAGDRPVAAALPRCSLGPAHHRNPADPGLARARTALSWTRTAISLAALGAAILKSRPYAGVPVLILSGLIWGLGQLARAPATGRDLSRRLLLVAIALTGVSFVALAIALLGTGSADAWVIRLTRH